MGPMEHRLNGVYLARALDALPLVGDALARWGLLRRRDPVERLGLEFDRLVITGQGDRRAPPSLRSSPATPSGASPSARLPAQPIVEDALVVRDLRKAYKSRVVVRDAALTLKRGQAVGLLGPNGAGKTTIFYMITGLVLPDAGSIHMDGQDITRLPMYQRARLGIGYLPQEASIFRGMSVAQNIMAVLELVEPNPKARRVELDKLLEEFGISSLRDTPSIALSGGERRRCEIARSLASRPAFILLDEPFAGVDPIAVNDIRNLVRHLTTRGIGVLITDHNVRETLGLIDRATIIHSGSVLTEGTPQSIIANEDARRLYLGEGFTL
jgi:lipopolysaccharide export system ATP-binding protein